MQLDLTKLNSGFVNSIDINQNIEIPHELYENSSVKLLKDLLLKGTIYKNSAGIITIQANMSGIMEIEDSISLELLDYPFSCEIDEEIEDFAGNCENILDITDILWQNIMLEVPLKFTRVEDFNEYQGDGWKLVDEDSIKSTNNPFNELKDIMGEE